MMHLFILHREFYFESDYIIRDFLSPSVGLQ